MTETFIVLPLSIAEINESELLSTIVLLDEPCELCLTQFEREIGVLRMEFYLTTITELDGKSAW